MKPLDVFINSTYTKESSNFRRRTALNQMLEVFLLAQTSAYYQAAEVRYAEDLGIQQGRRYCAGFQNGVRTKDQMVNYMVTTGGAGHRESNTLYLRWHDEGRRTLTDAYINGLQAATDAGCPAQMDRYLRENKYR